MTRAIRAYQNLSNTWSSEKPSAAQVADIAVDAGIAIEAALKGIIDHLGVKRSDSRKRSHISLLEKIAKMPEIASAIAVHRPIYGASIEVVRHARNRAVHGGNPIFVPEQLLPAIRDAIRLVLQLGCAFDVLGKQWTFPQQTVQDELWAFDEQPSFFGAQDRETFSGKDFWNCRAGYMWSVIPA